MKSVSKAIRVPHDLLMKIQEYVRETGLNEHATMLKLLEEGLRSVRLGDTQQQVKHLASQLDALVKGK